MTNSLFDHTVSIFTQNTDTLLEKGAYVRGALFVEAAKATIAPNSRVLDYGCGPGRIARLIAEQGYQVHGIDPSTGMIAEARRQDLDGLPVLFEVSRGNGEQLKTGAYDGVICSSVIEYVPDAQALLRHFHRSLRPDGALIISYANKCSLWRQYANWRFGRTAAHADLQRNIWSFAEFRRILDRAGFEVISRPRFFDASPFDKRPYLSFLSSLSFIGTLGLVVAQRRPSSTRSRSITAI